MSPKRFAAIGFILVSSLTFAQPARGESRVVVPLDGEWQLAEGGMEQSPKVFDHRIAVPGLVDMARPAFEEVGRKSERRAAFWYRRTFRLEADAGAVAMLKIHKAAYGTRVWMNGSDVGEHLGCFTPGYFDVHGKLKPAGQENELVVRVGASPESLPPHIPAGSDFEKVVYTPGIYDCVELIVSGEPFVARAQVVPDIEHSTARVVATLRSDRPCETDVNCEVHEAKGGKLAGSARSEKVRVEPGQEATVDVKVPLKDAHLWSPEDPFLYELRITTAGDEYRTRFGMRSFKLDNKAGRAILNGKPYFLRGTNVCIFRFFEDADHGDKAWNVDWVRKLHRAFKSMHWNSARYCIGFPPESWYRIADEEGYLIQDEFPLWGDARLKTGLNADVLAGQYREWMQERWNHPCVVIWDAQNETVTPETGKAIGMVRSLDLSGRPWDNGWSPPQSAEDSYEAHPYLFSNPNAKLGDLPRHAKNATGSPVAYTPGRAIINNEYSWLWLNRDGTPTTLTRKVYENLIGADATPEQRRELYARNLAAETECYRAQQRQAGVLHFCGLTYSRKNGQTCDNFVNLETLAFEPHFYKYVRDAFAPVGVMVDFWAEEPDGGTGMEVPVVVINDLYEPTGASVDLRMLAGERVVYEAVQNCRVEPLGRTQVKFNIKIPEQTGKYQLVAELTPAGGEPVRSLRDFRVLTPEQKLTRDGIAKGKPVKASSVVTVGGESFPAEFAVDGLGSTRWSSEFADPQWLAVDLGEATKISRVEIRWENAFAKAYAIQVSTDGQTWTDVYKTDDGKGGTEVIRFSPTTARWVRMHATQRGTQFGCSIWEFKVFP